MAHNYASIVRTFFLFGGISGRIVFTRLRLLITSVLREIGRGRPCSLRNKPQALHRTEPYSSRRHNGVVEVVQFWQVGCEEALEAIATKTQVGSVDSDCRKRGPVAIYDYRDN